MMAAIPTRLLRPAIWTTARSWPVKPTVSGTLTSNDFDDGATATTSGDDDGHLWGVCDRRNGRVDLHARSGRGRHLAEGASDTDHGDGDRRQGRDGDGNRHDHDHGHQRLADGTAGAQTVERSKPGLARPARLERTT